MDSSNLTSQFCSCLRDAEADRVSASNFNDYGVLNFNDIACDIVQSGTVLSGATPRDNSPELIHRRHVKFTPMKGEFIADLSSRSFRSTSKFCGSDRGDRHMYRYVNGDKILLSCPENWYYDYLKDSQPYDPCIRCDCVCSCSCGCPLNHEFFGEYPVVCTFPDSVIDISNPTAQFAVTFFKLPWCDDIECSHLLCSRRFEGLMLRADFNVMKLIGFLNTMIDYCRVYNQVQGLPVTDVVRGNIFEKSHTYLMARQALLITVETVFKQCDGSSDPYLALKLGEISFDLAQGWFDDIVSPVIAGTNSLIKSLMAVTQAFVAILSNSELSHFQRITDAVEYLSVEVMGQLFTATSDMFFTLLGKVVRILITAFYAKGEVNYQLMRNILYTIVRYVAGYPVKFIVMELILARTIDPLIFGKDRDKIVYDSAEGDTPITMAISALIMTAIGAFKGKFDLNYFYTLIKQAGDISRGFSTLGVSSLFLKLEKLIGLETDPISFLRVQFPDSFDFIDEHEKWVINSDTRSFLGSLRLKKAYDRYLIERKTYGSYARQMAELCGPACKTMHSMNVENSRPKLPCMFTLFHGVPGIGKSLMTGWLADQLTMMYREMRPADAATLSDFQLRQSIIYHVNPTDKFMSGYQGHRVVLYDDWMQMVDQGNGHPDISLMFAAGNSWPEKLNMADVSDKGKPCYAEVAIGGTNLNLVVDGKLSHNALGRWVKSVVDAEAVLRRITYYVHVTVKDTFKVEGGQVLSKIDQTIRIGNADFSFKANEPVMPIAFKAKPDLLYNYRVYTFNHSRACTWDEIVNWSMVHMRSGLDLELENSKLDKPQGKEEDEEAIRSKFNIFKQQAGIMDDDDYTLPLVGGPVFRNGEHEIEDIPRKRAVFIATGKKCACYEHPNDEDAVGFRACLLSHCSVMNRANVYYKFLDFTGKLQHQDVADIVVPDLKHYITFRDRKEINTYLVVGKCIGLRDNNGGKIIDYTRLPGSAWDIELTEDNNILSLPIGKYTIFVGIKASDYVLPHSHMEVKSKWNTTQTLLWGLGCLGILAAAAVAYVKISECIKDGLQDPHDQAQGIVEINGMKYYSVIGRNKMVYYYPCDAVQGQFFDRATSKRMAEQEPSIFNNIYAVCNLSGDLVGNVLFISDTQFICPAHIADAILAVGAYFKRDSDLVSIIRVDGEIQHTMAPLGSDLVCMTITHGAVKTLRMVGARTIRTKFRSDSKVGEGRVAYRDRYGKLTVMRTILTDAVQPSTYCYGSKTYSHAIRDIMISQQALETGCCGGVYIVEPEGNEGVIIGIHVARKNSTGESILRKVTLDMLPSDEGFSARVKGINGKIRNDGGVASLDGSMPLSKNDIVPTRIPQGSNFDSSLSEYVPAPIDELVEAHQKNRLVMASQEMKDLSSYPSDIVSAIANEYKFVSEDIARDSPSFDYVVRSEELGSIDASKASGVPYNKIGPTKAIIFSDVEKRILSSEAREELESMEKELCPEDITEFFDPHDGVECVVNASLKVEVRPIEKAVVGATRVFAGANVLEFILQRKYFYRFVQLLTQRNIAVNSALGIPPKDLNLVNELALLIEDPVTLTGDFKHMDTSFNAYGMDACAAVINEWYGNQPGAPLVQYGPYKWDRDCLMRARLIKRMARVMYMFRNSLHQLLIAHPSGSFITSVLNHVKQKILWTSVIAAYHKCSAAKAITMYKAAFVGDDSQLFMSRSDAVPGEFIIDQMAKYGFEVTSERKDADLDWQEVYHPSPRTKSNYTFLSHHYSPVGGLLTPQRFLKILGYTLAKREYEVFPATVLSFIDMYKAWHRFNRNDPTCVAARCQLNAIRPGFSSDVLLLEPADITKAVQESMDANVIVKDTLLDGIVVKRSPVRYDDDSEFILMDIAQGKQPDTAFDDAYEKSKCEMDSWYVENSHPGLSEPDADFRHIAERPFKITTVSWPTTANVGDILWTADFPTKLFDGYSKLQSLCSNYAALSGVLVVKAVLNSSPKQSGMLRLIAKPLNGIVGSVYQSSAHPGVYLDASSGSNVFICVPCILPQRVAMLEYYNDVPEMFDWCNISLQVFNALRDQATLSASITIFAWLKDVRVVQPCVTDYSFSAQGRDPELEAKFKARMEANQRHALDVTSFMPDGPIVPEYDNPDEVELDEPQVNEDATVTDSEPNPVVSNPSSAPRFQAGVARYESSDDTNLGRSLKRVGAVIRTFGSIAVDTLGAVNAGYAVAALAGFSKPSVEGETPFMVEKHNSTYPNAIGPVSDVVMATSRKSNMVHPIGIFGTSEDEMDIVRFCSREGLVRSFPWSASQATGTLLLAFNVQPGNCGSSGSGYYSPSPLCLVAMLHQYWRGGIEYRISISKTRFHSGSLEIILVGGTGQVTLTKDSQAASCHRVIWDVQEKTEIVLQVPFDSIFPWNITQVEDISSGSDNNHTIKHVHTSSLGMWELIGNGCIYIRVLNPLVASDGDVVSTVDLNLFQRGMSDIEFALPAVNKACGGTTTPAPFDPKGKEEEIWDEAQGGPGVFTEKVSTVHVMREARPISPIDCAACPGDRVTNLRTIFRRFYKGDRTTVINKVVATGTIDKTVAYSIQFRKITSLAIARGELWNYVANCFGFFSGGFRIDLRACASYSLIALFVDLEIFRFNGLNSDYSYPTLNDSLSFESEAVAVYRPAMVNDNPTFDSWREIITCPGSHLVRFVPTGQLTGSSPGYRCHPESLLVRYRLQNGTISNDAVTIVTSWDYSFSDDFTLGWQMGCPDISASTSTSHAMYPYVGYN